MKSSKATLAVAFLFGGCSVRVPPPARRRQRGFTLVEVAVVLVIIGLLLGGVLKGQELITGARVRALIRQHDAIKAAYYGFFDRYRGLPGDYALATAHIAAVSTTACNGGNGDGDGRIETQNDEHTLVWEHLARAGFIEGAYVCAASVGPATSPTNPGGRPLELVFDENYAGPQRTPRHILKTGSQVASDLLAEIDRKVDDGNALRGAFRGQVDGGVSPDCYDAEGAWAAHPAGPNCGGATLL